MKSKNQTIDGGFLRRNRESRRGAAVVEFAVVSPILLLLFLGIVEVGQFVNLGQSVSNASREGARVAARQVTASATDVQTAVTNYLTNMHPTMPSSAVQVSVSNTGGPVTNGDLTTVNAGLPIYVKVDVQFDPVRWLHGLPLLDGTTVSSTTVTRRE